MGQFEFEGATKSLAGCSGSRMDILTVARLLA